MSARVHGGLDAEELRRLGLDPASIVDFSVNLNPYGPYEPVIAAARSAALEHYPDPQAIAARMAWAEQLGCPVAALTVGHGAADLFWAITRALIAPGERVVIAEPTFSELRVAAEACGARVERVFAPEERGFSLDFGKLAEAARGARALYLCSPNNPTGEHLPIARVRELAAALPHTYLLLDHSFIALSDHADDAAAALPPNVLRVRSLTKEFACPGLRIGLCVGEPELLARIDGARPTWHTSSPALAALSASASALAQSFVRTSWLRMRADREATRVLLEARGLRPLPSESSYQLVPLAVEARELRLGLLRQGVSLRDCSSFGLPRHVRVAALPAAARERLGRALDAIALA